MNKLTVIKNFKVIPYLYGISFTPMKTFQSLSEKFGDVVSLKFWNESVYFVNDPIIIQYILKTNYSNFPRSNSILDLKPLLGKGLFISEDELWQSQRKLLTPAFHNSSLENFYTVLDKELNVISKKLDNFAEQNNSIDLEHELKILLLNMTIKNMLSTDILFDADSLLKSLSQILTHTQNKWHNLRLVLSFFRKDQLRLFDFRKNKIALKVITNFTDKTVQDAFASKINPAGLLLILLEAYKSKSIDEQQIKDEIQTILFAGYDTVAEGILWLIYFLSRDKALMNKVMAEISEKENNDHSARISMSDNAFLTSCIKETLRLMPPAWSFYRTVKDDTTFNEITFPKRALIMISPYILHRNKKYWKNAEIFDPSRFLDDNPTDPFHYIPFGHGPHICIGNRLAMIEIHAVAYYLLKNYEFTFESPNISIPSLFPSAIISSKEKIAVKVKRRLTMKKNIDLQN